MTIITGPRVRTTFLLPFLLITACGGGGGGTPAPQTNTPQPPATYKVGGSVSGLVGSGLTLALNGSGNVSVSGNGPFTFPNGIAGQSSYTVTVAAQPSSPSQLCTVSNGSGSVAAADITTVSVSCQFVGRFAYASGIRGGIDAYSINHSTGLLTPLPGDPFPAAVSYTNSVTLHPNGKFVYAVDPGYATPSTTVDGLIAVYSIDNTTGIPTAIPGSPFTVAAFPSTLAFHPNGKFAFAPDSVRSASVLVFAIDPGTGVPTQISSSPFACNVPPNSVAIPISVAVAPSGSFVYFGTQAGGAISGLICGYSIDANTGFLTPVPGSPYAATTPSLFATSLTFEPSGKFLYVAGPGSFRAFSVDPTSGALTAISGPPPDLTNSNSQTLAVDPAGKFLYVTDTAQAPYSQIFVYSIDPATGLLAPISGSPFATPQYPVSITIDPSGDLAYVALGATGIGVYSVNKATGALSPIGSPIPNGGTGAIAVLQ